MEVDVSNGLKVDTNMDGYSSVSSSVFDILLVVAVIVLVDSVSTSRLITGFVVSVVLYSSVVFIVFSIVVTSVTRFCLIS